MAHRLSNINDDARTATCSVCGPVEFWVTNRRDRIERSCANKRKEAKNEWYRRTHGPRRPKQTPEEKREYHRQWHQRHREERLDVMRKRYQDNRESAAEYNRSYYAENREQLIEKAIRWQRENPERRSAYSARRKAQATVGMSTQDLRESSEHRRRIADDPCFYCGEKKSRMHYDHIVPLVHGGTDHAHNIVRACPSCNCSKKDRSMDEFLQRRG